MIIPIRCMNCGFVLADAWKWYQQEVARLRKQQGNTTNGSEKTPERQACDTLGITRYCCRKHLLTHRDILEKI